MSKNIIVILVTLVCLLSGCETTTQDTVVTPYEYSDFKLVCDSKTNIVYIDNVVKIVNEEISRDRWYHIYTPYYSKNGNICRFVDNRMIEIERVNE